ncbi:MAG: secondary thiamine-phosphate synthase enzyme YjbQ [Endomicrobia bacterium]|nr:secondary thiamine-phosphate synthase enzyme YjbQ [Endomicrobiia bacterium]
MKIYQKEFSLQTSTRIEFIDITSELNKYVRESKINNGVCYIFIPHTTSALTINENADSNVVKDIINKINKLIPQRDLYSHLEGNSDAHIKTSLFTTSLSIFVENNKLKLGTWQGIYFCEFDGPRLRNVWIKILGE